VEIHHFNEVSSIDFLVELVAPTMQDVVQVKKELKNIAEFNLKVS
jgi:hypothetical protein